MIDNKIVFLIIFIFFACETHKKDELIEKEEARIFSFFIDELATSYPPPPPPPRDGSTRKKINWDSISRIRVRLVVDTIMSNFKQKANVPKEFEGFQYLADNINNLPEKGISKELVESEVGHNLIFGNTLEDFKGEHPQMVFISRIAFNDKMDQAALYAGRTSGKLSGYVNFYLLKKKNNKWKIIFKKNVEIS